MYRTNESFWKNLNLVGGDIKKRSEVKLPNGLDMVHVAETEDTIAFLSEGWGAHEAFGALLEVATGFEDEEQEVNLRGFQAFLEAIGYFDGVDGYVEPLPAMNRDGMVAAFEAMITTLHDVGVSSTKVRQGAYAFARELDKQFPTSDPSYVGKSQAASWMAAWGSGNMKAEAARYQKNQAKKK